MSRAALTFVLLHALTTAAFQFAPAAVRPAGAARAPSVVAAAPDLVFDLAEDRSQLKFGCRQRTVTMVKPEPGGTLQEFILSNADAMVVSSWDAGQVRRVEGEESTFFINVEEFNFLVLKIAVELKAKCSLDEATATAKLESLGFRLLTSRSGLESVLNSIEVKVRGALTPTAPDARICALNGRVESVATGKLPSVLRGAPEGALRAATRAMSELIMAAATERFSQRVPKAYATWARQREASGAARSP